MLIMISDYVLEMPQFTAAYRFSKPQVVKPWIVLSEVGNGWAVQGVVNLCPEVLPARFHSACERATNDYRERFIILARHCDSPLFQIGSWIHNEHLFKSHGL